MLRDEQIIFRQLFDRTSCTYSYVLGCARTREAVLIDPVFAHHQRDMALLQELELKLVAVLDTHVHADHITGAWLAREATGCRIALAKVADGPLVDFPLVDGDSIPYGDRMLRTRATPGHTNGCLSYVDNDARFVFTGDALMIRGTGRTDFQEGSAAGLYESIQEQLFSLPDDCVVLPGHDYSGRATSTIGEERSFNPRIGGGASTTDFVGHLENLDLPHPQHIDAAVPANLQSGRPPDGTYPTLGTWAPLTITYAGIPEITAQWLAANRNRVHLIDVRESNELTGTLGALSGVRHIPLDRFRDEVASLPTDLPIVVICRSGRRSGLAVKIMQSTHRTDVANLRGGMLEWRKKIGSAKS